MVGPMKPATAPYGRPISNRWTECCVLPPGGRFGASTASNL